MCIDTSALPLLLLCDVKQTWAAHENRFEFFSSQRWTFFGSQRVSTHAKPCIDISVIKESNSSNKRTATTKIEMKFFFERTELIHRQCDDSVVVSWQLIVGITSTKAIGFILLWFRFISLFPLLYWMGDFFCCVLLFAIEINNSQKYVRHVKAKPGQ